MTNISGASNYLNNQQLMTISDNLVGVSKTSNASLFNDVKRLDEDKDEEIERPESGIAKLVSLGNAILNKLANLFGMDLNKPIENQPPATFEDAQNEQIVENYFKPITNKVMDASPQQVKEGALENMVNAEQIEYTFNAIKADKQSQGLEVISEVEGENRKEVIFSDGSDLSISNDGKYITYNAPAADGSEASAQLEYYNNGPNIEGFSIGEITSDRKGPSIIDEFDYSNGNLSQEELNKKDNAETYTRVASYEHESFANGSSTENIYQISKGRDHTKKVKGVGDSEVYTNSIEIGNAVEIKNNK